MRLKQADERSPDAPESAPHPRVPNPFDTFNGLYTRFQDGQNRSCTIILAPDLT
jgi:hypothetical protein